MFAGEHPPDPSPLRVPPLALCLKPHTQILQALANPSIFTGADATPARLAVLGTSHQHIVAIYLQQLNGPEKTRYRMQPQLRKHIVSALYSTNQTNSFGSTTSCIYSAKRCTQLGYKHLTDDFTRPNWLYAVMRRNMFLGLQ
jgi:hypothetical protein